MKTNSEPLDLSESFNNKDLYEQALTHRSWINENPGVRESNERLEFLGDAVLEFIVSSVLYHRLPDKEEGFLTALRANIVNTVNLAKLASKLKLGDKLHMSKGEKNGKGHQNPSLLANTVEAIIGAIYIDQGFEAAEKFIREQLLVDLEEKLKEPLKDPKSRFQEKVQSLGKGTPRYKVVEQSGPDHDKRFTVEVVVDDRVYASGSGSSINKAEQKAAENALSKNDN